MLKELLTSSLITIIVIALLMESYKIIRRGIAIKIAKKKKRTYKEVKRLELTIVGLFLTLICSALEYLAVIGFNGYQDIIILLALFLITYFAQRSISMKEIKAIFKAVKKAQLKALGITTNE